MSRWQQIHDESVQNSLAGSNLGGPGQSNPRTAATSTSRHVQRDSSANRTDLTRDAVQRNIILLLEIEFLWQYIFGTYPRGSSSKITENVDNRVKEQIPMSITSDGPRCAQRVPFQLPGLNFNQF